MFILFKIIKKILSLFDPSFTHLKYSFSQDGEDLALLSFYESYGKDYKGFYIDIGAHHPFKFSNTFIFYQKGWRGINIDAMPGSMKLFQRYRKRDINIELGIGSSNNELTFYCFNEPALNTFDENVAKSRDGVNGFHIIKKETVKVLTLADALNKYLPSGIDIDFISIDAEGFDYDVLASNSWDRYKPRHVLVESFGKDSNFEKIRKLLESKGYVFTGRFERTVFFTRSN